MIISIDDGLTALYDELKNKGYAVHRFSEGGGADVIIYSGTATSLSSLTSGDTSGSGSGVFLINGDNLDGAGIDKIIRNRVYSSLF